VIGRTQTETLLKRVLALSTADETEVVLMGLDEQLTRFAGNAIHQHVAETNRYVVIRAALGRRVGVGTTNDLTDAGLQRALESAVAAARLRPEDPHFPGLAGPTTLPEVTGFDDATAGCTPAERARTMRTLCRRAEEMRCIAAGAFRTSTYEWAVANSHDLFAYHPATEADLTTVVMTGDSSGFAAGASSRVADVDVVALGEQAIHLALRGRYPQPVEPGVYPVVLSPYAAHDLLETLATAAGAVSVQEGRSWMSGSLQYEGKRSGSSEYEGKRSGSSEYEGKQSGSSEYEGKQSGSSEYEGKQSGSSEYEGKQSGCRGERLLSPLISIWDDGLDPAGWPLPFDFEGLPRQRTDIVRDGAIGSAVYDRARAAIDGVTSTGHALPAANPFNPWLTATRLGPVPLHAHLGTGDSTVEDMIARTERGLYVTRFWYTRTVHPREVVVTGMTRDGTFLIEHGELTTPVRNLRFTQSYVKALAGTEAVGHESHRVWTNPGILTAPALKLAAFRFTGATKG